MNNNIEFEGSGVDILSFELKADGTGLTLVTSHQLKVGDLVHLYSINRSPLGEFKDNIDVTWGLTGDIGSLNISSKGKDAVFTAAKPGNGEINIFTARGSSTISLNINPLASVTSSWSFLDPLKYLFSSNHIEVTNGKASLKQVDLIHSGTDFNNGTHVGTYVNGGGNLSLDLSANYSFDPAWTPKWNNVIHYFNLDNDATATVGTDGTLVSGGAGLDSAPGHISTSILFDGSDQINFTALPTTQITISYWARADALTGSCCPRPISMPAFDMFYSSGTVASTFKVNFSGGASEWRTASNSTTLGEWQHVLISYDGANLTNSPAIYLDGELQNTTKTASGSGTLISNAGAASIGNVTDGSRPWTGTIDEIAYWNTTLNEEEAFKVYSFQKQRFTSNGTHASAWTPHWSSVVGYWRMDGDWQDSSGKGNHGAQLGNTTFSTNSIVGSTSGTFDGVDDYLSIPNDSSIMSDEVSISMWIYPKSFNDGGIISKDPAAGYSISIDSASEKLKFVDYGAPFSLTTQSRIPLNTWTHVSFVATLSFQAFYINGEFDNAGSIANHSMNNNANLNIGSISTTVDFFDGALDDVTIWNVKLSGSEVNEIYNRQKQKYTGHYESPIVDLGSSAPWPYLSAVTSLPFYKELTGSTGNESSSDYTLLVGSTGATTDNDLMSGLVGLWHLNELTATAGGNNDLIDYSGSANHGEQNGGILFDQKGVMGGAVAFDGVDDSIDILDSPSIRFTDFTFSVWLNLESLPGLNDTYMIINKYAAVNLPNYRITVGDYFSAEESKPRVQFWDGVAWQAAIAQDNLTINTWYHIVGTFDSNDSAGTLKVFVNGEMTGTVSNTGPLPAYTTSSLRIGRSIAPDSDRFEFHGRLDEIAMWDRPLNSGEIKQLYRRGSNRIKYQVKSCVDANCNCIGYSGASPDTDDCNGDDINNDIDADQTGVAQWIGNNGPNSSFSELQNCTSIDGSNGECIGQVNTSSPNFDFSSLSNIFPAVSQPINNRYFQYRVLLEAEDSVVCLGLPCVPELSSVEFGPTGKYYGGSPTIIPTVPMNFTNVTDISFTEIGSCSLTYQLSPDGSTYYYWNGTNWTSTSNAVAESSSSSTIMSNISSFAPQSGPGNLYWKAFITSNSNQLCELDEVSVTVGQ